jgi:formylglycine-generating enzyme
MQVSGNYRLLKKKDKRIALVLLLAFLGVIGYFGWRTYLKSPGETEGTSTFVVISNAGVSVSTTGTDGKAILLGKTDSQGQLTVDTLHAGDHELTLSLTDYQSDTVKVSLSKGHPAELKKQLQPLPGRLKLAGSVGLQVYEGGQRLGQANAWIELSAGDHDLDLRCHGFHTERMTVTILPNRPLVKQSPSLVADSGTIMISAASTVPQDNYLARQQARIRIDNGPWRLVSLPLTQEGVSCESHRVEMQIPGYSSPPAQDREVTGNQIAEVEFQLTPELGTVTFNSNVPDSEVYDASGHKLEQAGAASQLAPFISHQLTVKAPGHKSTTVTVLLDQPGAQNVTKSVTLEKASGLGPGEAWAISELDMTFAYVAPGSFQMGSNEGEIDEAPVHTVTLSQGYWMGKHEVTHQQYESIVGDHSNMFKGSTNPVEKVSWNDAVVFCRTLTKQERQAGRLPAGYEYRLPTEAEWEYAARGGSDGPSANYAGSNSIDEVAWYKENSGKKTHPVGQKQANELGLHDMTGNVWEWCLDWYGEYPSEAQTNPTGPSTGAYRVLHGGAWYCDMTLCRETLRYRFTPASAYGFLGFRVALAPAVR